MRESVAGAPTLEYRLHDTLHDTLVEDKDAVTSLDCEVQRRHLAPPESPRWTRQAESANGAKIPRGLGWWVSAWIQFGGRTSRTAYWSFHLVKCLLLACVSLASLPSTHFASAFAFWPIRSYDSAKPIDCEPLRFPENRRRVLQKAAEHVTVSFTVITHTACHLILTAA